MIWIWGHEAVLLPIMHTTGNQPTQMRARRAQASSARIKKTFRASELQPQLPVKAQCATAKRNPNALDLAHLAANQMKIRNQEMHGFSSMEQIKWLGALTPCAEERTVGQSVGPGQSH